MVTGAYHPEITGGGNQCRTLVRALRPSAHVDLLSVSNTPELPAEDVVDGVRVRRITVNPRRLLSTIAAAVSLTRTCLSACVNADVVHLHGYTRKSALVAGLAKLLGRPVVLKIGGVGQDAPSAIRTGGIALRLAYASVDRFVAPSAAVAHSLQTAGVAAERVEAIANGVDLERFRPATADERTRLRGALGLPREATIVLFVGMLAPVKRPELLFEAWSTLGGAAMHSTLVFCPTRSGYHEIDTAIADTIRSRAAALGLADRVRFVEPTFAIEELYRAADIFVLPSAQEGLPNALLEAMASGLAPVASRLEGITDTVIEHGKSGLLVESGSAASLAEALRALLGDPARARALGREARAVAVERYGIERTAAAHLALYRRLLTS